VTVRNFDILIYASCSGRHVVWQVNVNFFAERTVRSPIWR